MTKHDNLRRAVDITALQDDTFAVDFNVSTQVSRRDLVQEIVARRERNPESGRIAAFSARHQAIAAAFQSLLKQAAPDATAIDAELSRYFPIALVAAIEGYFRQCIADLVNAGAPFLERAAKLKDINISLVAAAALQDKRITLGEYVAHFISIGTLDDINRAMSTLLDFDFLERLLTSEFAVFNKEDPLHLREARGEVITALSELFQTRHMLCHEFAPEVQLDIGSLTRFFTVADVVAALSEVIVWAEEGKRC